MYSVTEAGAPAAPLGFRPLLAMAVGAKYEGYPRGGARVLEWTASAAPGGEPVMCWIEHLTAPNKLR